MIKNLCLLTRFLRISSAGRYTNLHWHTFPLLSLGFITGNFVHLQTFFCKHCRQLIVQQKEMSNIFSKIGKRKITSEKNPRPLDFNNNHDIPTDENVDFLSASKESELFYVLKCVHHILCLILDRFQPK